MPEIRIGFLGLLQILFIGLKLIGFITWSWIWVLSPLIISFGAIFVIFAIIVIYYIIIVILNNSE